MHNMSVKDLKPQQLGRHSEEVNEGETLTGVLADSHCHQCEGLLCFESQRLSHCEGKKHVQKMKMYLQGKRAEMNRESPTPQWDMTSNKDHFCELCSMVFNSNVVAKSHYEGKVHLKNLRKVDLLQSDRCEGVNIPLRASQTPDKSDQTSAPEGKMEVLQAPTAAAPLSSTAVDLRDSNKYCSLCDACFNKPQKALQHYKGHKHQKLLARQKLLKELGDNVEPAYTLICRKCRIEFNCVPMYHAHVQGCKHQTRKKPVVKLCKSQQKVYTSFIDELADYIQDQKARGITPKGSHVLPQGDTQEENDEEQEGSEKGDTSDVNDNLKSSLPPSSHLPHHPASYCPPSYQEPACLPHGWDYNYPLPDALGPSHLQPVKRRRLRSHSSSCSYTTSSPSYGSSTSDSGDNEYRRRQKNIKRSKRKRSTGGRDEGSDKEGRKGRKRERDHDSKRRKEQSNEDRRRKKAKKYGQHRRKEGRFHRENFKVEDHPRVMDRLKPENMMKSKTKTELEVQDENNVEPEELRKYEPSTSTNRKKKMKKKEDTRTEEEKLWDDSILGC